MGHFCLKNQEQDFFFKTKPAPSLFKFDNSLASCKKAESPTNDSREKLLKKGTADKRTNRQRIFHRIFVSLVQYMRTFARFERKCEKNMKNPHEGVLHSSVCAYHVFWIVKMVPNRAGYHIWQGETYGLANVFLANLLLAYNRSLNICVILPEKIFNQDHHLEIISIFL